tara:strand:- start:578 stop:730 length:153 start_codon:yes stop_codon:yes gene_type:complete
MTQAEAKNTLSDDILGRGDLLERIQELEEELQDLRNLNQSLIDRLVGMSD